MENDIALYWFRQDLRLNDNPALNKAATHKKIIAIYISDTKNTDEYVPGSASRCWLHHSLNKLNQDLNNQLNFYAGDPETIIKKLIERFSISSVYWNRCYEPWQTTRDKKIKEMLKKNHRNVESFNGSLLWEPWEVLKQDSTPYKVFTAFYKNGCLKAFEPRTPFSKPKQLNLLKDPESTLLDQLHLLPTIGWDKNILKTWSISEESSHRHIKNFFEASIFDYKTGRDFPAKNSVSRLSPYLHFGQISPHQLWHIAKMQSENDNIDHFCRELIWREFSYYLLYHFPDLPKKNIQSKFDAFPWRKNKKQLKTWQRGQTGYPLVDAGMRELWQTGYMHNRVRMIVASFLVKNLMIHWHEGERWFWDCLLDADLANNSASWQWVAGSGMDAAPYFRIFNPTTQGEKFDAEGEYTKKFIPELSKLPAKYLFQPWNAPKHILEKAGVILGVTYPYPMVDLQESRNRALEAFKQLTL